MPIARRRATRPTFHKPTHPAKPSISPAQMKWTLNKTADVSPGGCLAVPFYTVPKGFKLTLGGGFVSCNASCIQNVRMVHTPGIIGDFRFDVRGELLFTELSGQEIPAGHTITTYVFNNDSVERNFSITLTGFLEVV